MLTRSSVRDGRKKKEGRPWEEGEARELRDGRAVCGGCVPA